jgi:hypothetical protein
MVGSNGGSGNAHRYVSGGYFETCGGAVMLLTLTMERLWIVETEADWLLELGRRKRTTADWLMECGRGCGSKMFIGDIQ